VQACGCWHGGWPTQPSRKAAKLVGSRGRGVATHRAGWAVTAQGGGGRVCRQREALRGPGLRAMRGGGTWLAWSNLVAMEGVEQKGNGTEGARRFFWWLNAKVLDLQCIYATFIGCCSALRGCKYEGVNTTSPRELQRRSRRAHVTAAMKHQSDWPHTSCSLPRTREDTSRRMTYLNGV